MMGRDSGQGLSGPIPHAKPTQRSAWRVDTASGRGLGAYGDVEQEMNKALLIGGGLALLLWYYYSQQTTVVAAAPSSGGGGGPAPAPSPTPSLPPSGTTTAAALPPPVSTAPSPSTTIKLATPTADALLAFVQARLGTQFTGKLSAYQWNYYVQQMTGESQHAVPGGNDPIDIATYMSLRAKAGFTGLGRIRVGHWY